MNIRWEADVSDCLFCKIAAGEIPADKVHDDGELFAINDLNPAAPVHLLIIPHEHVETIAAFDETHRETVGRVYELAASIASKRGFSEPGYRVVANCNRDGGQTVFHVHFHLLAGRAFAWPPG
jgi:histidine triad (HIT) family protein